MSRRPLLLALVVTGVAAAGFGLGVGTAHWTAATQWPLLSPSSAAPRDQEQAERRAIALVAGQTRAADGLTFDAWYRLREARLHPGVDFTYRGFLDGNDLCGYWEVEAIPNSGSVQTQPLATVDEQTAAVSGTAEPGGSHVSYYSFARHCAFAAAASDTWLDQFRAGAAP